MSGDGHRPRRPEPAGPPSDDLTVGGSADSATTRRWWQRFPRREDGSATVELALVSLIMVIFLMNLVGMARIYLAKQAVAQAASDGARAASLARTPEDAYAGARLVVDQTMAEEGFSCVTSSVDVDAARLGVSIGQRATVSVTVTCQIDLSDTTGFTLLPGSLTTWATEVSPVDVYRGE